MRMVIHEIQIKITQQIGQLIFFSNLSQKRFKILNKVIDVRIWRSVDDTNRERMTAVEGNAKAPFFFSSVEGDDMSGKAKLNLDEV